ncbi:hypothetical protein CEXT_743851 [Caerostris extrusa]|uniref:Uncharacterized protein n=1 Tax=Caerostris extrusa TaxID=172846 RepID=A0AAV4VJH4_CAEEX|nr:hypothetical protein CEXT_743851 [Caerostris extrusa]
MGGTPVRREIGTSRTRKLMRFKSVGIGNQRPNTPNLRCNRTSKRKSSMKRLTGDCRTGFLLLEQDKSLLVWILKSTELLRKSIPIIQNEEIVELENSIAELVDKETQTEKSIKANNILKRNKRMVGTPVRRDSNIGIARKSKRDRFKSVGIDTQQPNTLNLRYNRTTKAKSSMKRHSRSRRIFPIMTGLFQHLKLFN